MAGKMTYGAELSAAWAAAVAPRAEDAPTVVSTFAGCGGSSLGYAMAGFRELLTVEWDDHAAKLLERNIAADKHIAGDIANVNPDILGLAPGELDVLDGSPPCQGFSTAGLRILDDPRNGLFREFARLLKAWMPKAFVMENVTGLAQGKMRLVLADIIDTLTECGYRVKVAELRAEYFRVPQTRHRIIFIGIRNDLGVEPSHPRGMSLPIPVREAWADLDDPGLIVRPSERYARLCAAIEPGRKGADVLQQRGGRRSYFNTMRLHWEKPSPTIYKSFAKGLRGFLHPAENRFISSRELTRVQSFPDEYDWAGSSYKEVHARIGNSVPPLLMRAIALHLRGLLAAAR